MYRVSSAAVAGLAALLAATAMAQSGNMSRMSGSTRMQHNGMRMGRMSGGSINSTDRTFVKKAAQGGIAEVEQGKLAQQNGSEAVKQMGETLVTDHSQANEQLKQICTQLMVPCPTTPSAKERATVSMLRSLHGAAFNSKFLKEQRIDHVKDIALFKKEASQGGSRELRQFAQSTLPTLQKHLSMVTSMSSGSTMHAHRNMGNGR